MKSETDMRANERGAVKAQTVLTFVLVIIVAFVVIKITPVYFEERNLQNQVDELARISAVRNYKQDEVKKGIDRIVTENSLQPENLILSLLAENKVQLRLQYKRTIDFLVMQYDWNVDYTADGRAL